MADRPIIFSAPMVRALLDGRKTQTRRVLKPQPKMRTGVNPNFSQLRAHHLAGDRWMLYGSEEASEPFRLPYAVGDRLWVRESFYQIGHWEPVQGQVTRKGRRQRWRFVAANDDALFDPPTSFRKGRHAADPGTQAWHQRLGRFMPRRYSRLTLTVTDVRVQRLQEIEPDDCYEEGAVCDMSARTVVEHFRNLWNRVNGPAAWDANPWVCAVTFTVERRNIDARESA